MKNLSLSTVLSLLVILLAFNKEGLSQQEPIKIDEYLRLSTESRASDIAKSLAYADSALRLSEKTGDKAREADALNLYGVSLYFSGKYKEALNFYKKSLSLSDTLQLLPLNAKVMNNIGAVYFALAIYPEALNWYLQALRVREKINIPVDIAASYNNMGNVYQMTGKLDESRAYYNKSLAIKETIQDSAGIIQTLNNIANIYKTEAKYDSSKLIYEKVIFLASKIKNDLFLGTGYLNLSAIYSNREQYQKAIELLMKAVELQTITGDTQSKAISLLNLGENYFYLGNKSESRNFLNQAVNLSKEIEDLEILKNCYNILSQLDESEGNFLSALTNFKLFSNLKDSLYNDEKSREIGRLEAAYSIEKEIERQKFLEEQRILRETEEINRRNSIQYSAIFIIVAVLFILSFYLGRLQISIKLAKSLIFLTFLIAFEFILVILDPLIQSITANVPLFILGVNCLLALVISPVHSYLEEKIRDRVITVRNHES